MFLKEHKTITEPEPCDLVLSKEVSTSLEC